MNQVPQQQTALEDAQSRNFRSLLRSLAKTLTAAKGILRRDGRLERLFLSRKDTSYINSPLTGRLPAELIDYIIDYNHDDKDTLLNLSLVCRALAPSVRYHLFDRMKITSHNASKISGLLTEGSSDIALYVRELTLEAGDGRSDQVFRELRAITSGKQPRTLLRTFFRIIAPRTRNVTRLVLKAVPLEKTIVGMLAPCFPKLNILSLFDCSFHCNADLDQLVRDHPAIHSLRAGRLCSFDGMTSGSSNTIRPRLVLRQLKITEAYSPAPLTLMPWLVGHCSPQHLIYTIYRLTQLPKINDAILEMKSLTHLHLIMCHWRREEMYELENMPSLASLTPRYPPMITTMTLDGKMHMLNLIVIMLAQLDPHSFVHLRTLNLWAHLEETDVSKVNPANWAGMDQTLSVLLSLGAVNIYNSCQTTDHIHAGSEAIEARLPVLTIRRLVRFLDLEAGF